MSPFYVLCVHCRGRAVTNVGKTCGPTPYLIRAINMFKLPKLSFGHLKQGIQAFHSRVKVGNDQEMMQSERNSHSKKRAGKKLN